MSPHLFSRFAALGLALSSALYSAEPAWKWQEVLVPDIGLDLDTAKVLKVTSLAPRGKGSLHEALTTKGPRLIVFEIAGVIELDRKSIEIHEPDVYIAGQTAPSPGITITHGGLSLEADRIVLQHLHVRPGDAGKAKGSGWEPDGITTSGGPADLWIDHCSATWSIDENISAATYKSSTGEPTRRVFIRDCLIAEGLNNATHGKGPHSKGTLVFDGTQQVAIVRNLYVSNVERNPVFKPNTSGVVVNNVMANPGQRGLHASPPDAGTELPKARIAAVANVQLGGRDTRKTAATYEGVPSEIFFKDNEAYSWKGEKQPLMRTPFPTLDAPPLWPEGLEATSTTEALWHIARFVGARPADRDPIDTRIVRDALTGAAKIIDSQEEVGGYPKIEPVTRPLDVPATGRRAWLEKITKEVVFGPEEAPAPKSSTPR